MNNQRVLQALSLSSDWEEYDTNMGRLCGIPECCIKNFIALDKIGIKNAAVMDQVYGRVINQPADATGGYYVLCPQCRRLRTTERVPYKKIDRYGKSSFSAFKELHS